MTLLIWSDDRVEMLKKLWEAGLSCSQIAAELGGGLSRNAVIGKIHRMGLSGRIKEPGRPRERKGRPKQYKAKTLHAPHDQPAPTNAEVAIATPEESFEQFFNIDTTNRVSLEGLTDDNCHWPIGTPGDDDFRFCGNHAPAGVPYCPGHARLAYQPGANRRHAPVGRVRGSSEIHFNRAL